MNHLKTLSTATLIALVPAAANAVIILEDDFDNVDNLTWVGTIANSVGALQTTRENYLTAIDLQAESEYVITLEVSLANSVGSNPYLSFGFLDALDGPRHNNASPAYIQFAPEAGTVTSKEGSSPVVSSAVAGAVAFDTTYIYSLVVTTDAVGTGATIDYTWTNKGTATAYALGSSTIADYTTTSFDTIGVSGDLRSQLVTGTIDNFSVDLVPEPSSLALLGLGGLLMARRRRDN